MAGHAVKIDLSGNSGDADFKRLADVTEVWTFAVRKPRPGYRFFGRFYERDHLILTGGTDRESLGSYADYQQGIVQAQTDWGQLFQISPITGMRIEDYVSGLTLDVSKPLI